MALTKREPTHVQIANRAFEIYVSRGADHGHDVGDWFEAQRQLKTELRPKKRAVKRLNPKVLHFAFGPRGSTVSGRQT